MEKQALYRGRPFCAFHHNIAVDALLFVDDGTPLHGQGEYPVRTHEPLPDHHSESYSPHGHTVDSSRLPHLLRKCHKPQCMLGSDFPCVGLLPAADVEARFKLVGMAHPVVAIFLPCLRVETLS